MKKRKVIWFFVLLLIFAFILAIIQIVRFNGIAGIVSFNQSNVGNEGSKIDFTLVGFFLFIFLFILIAGLIVRFLQNYHERNVSHNNNQGHRKLIKVDLNDSDKDNL